MAICKTLGARRIIAVAGTAVHAEIAKRMGATSVLDRHKCDVVAEIRKITGLRFTMCVVESKRCVTEGRGVDACLEMSGSAQALQQSLDAVMTTGIVSILGQHRLSLSRSITLTSTHTHALLQGCTRRRCRWMFRRRSFSRTSPCAGCADQHALCLCADCVDVVLLLCADLRQKDLGYVEDDGQAALGRRPRHLAGALL